MKRILPLVTVGLIAVLWIAGVAAGYAWLVAYEEKPGAIGPAPGAIAERDDERPLLRLFIHPHCPCSKASLTELAWILDHVKEPLECEVVFVRPDGVPQGWEKGSSWDKVQSMPNVRTRVDEGGALAKVHGVKTSGHVVLIDPTGQVLFSGGITELRGHVGDNAGRRLLLARLRHETKEIGRNDVFGCPVLNPNE